MHREQNSAYYHARQSCYTCLGTDNLVDTEVVIEGEGVLAICEGCVREMARTLGIDLFDQTSKIDALEIELADTKTALAEADAALATVAKSGGEAVKRQMARVREARAEKVSA
jgi:hypothetical protein